ncbi:MAG: glutathione S-transferase family protein [Parvibaculaceae bacterium]
MAKLHLIVGNKNYSSWSLRPWLAMTHAGIPFDETVIALDMPDTKAKIAEYSPAGKVPILHHGKVAVWETLAILEYVAEVFPEKKLWPVGKAARAMARAISNEMHAGFSALRNACPMNLRRPKKRVEISDAVRRDVARIEEIWKTARKAHGKGGKFLFGRFSNADAMYAPVVTRLDTYDIAVSKESRAYMDAVMGTPAFQSWRAAGLKEDWVIAEDEVD